MPNDYSDDRLRLVSRLYYLDGLGQSEVAKFAKVSQAKVSRLLALAKERGIVRITVADYDPRQRDLEEQLQARLGLEMVAVIKSSGGLEGSDLRRAVGHFGAVVIDALLQPRDIVAVTWADDEPPGHANDYEAMIARNQPLDRAAEVALETAHPCHREVPGWSAQRQASAPNFRRELLLKLSESSARRSSLKSDTRRVNRQSHQGL